MKTKYDTLEVELNFVEETDEDGDVSRYLTQTVFVNDKEFSGYLELSSLFVETSEFTKENKNTYYMEEYKQPSLAYGRSNGKYSSVYLDSCSCGAPGCSGIWNGIKVNKKKNCYLYRAKKIDGYDNGILGSGKWNLYISKENILQVRNEILSFVKQNKDKLEDVYDGRYLLNLLEDFT